MSNKIVLNSEEIATEILHRSLKTFQNTRAALEKCGFPQPIRVPGNPLWLRSEVVEWLESRSAKKELHACAIDAGATATIEEPVKRRPGRCRNDDAPRRARSAA